MTHSYYASFEHIAFSTKSRIPCLDGRIRPTLFAYLAQGATNQDCPCIKVGGHLEHVHLLVAKSKSLLTGDLVKELKRFSCIWLKQQTADLKSFAWQEGYGAFSVSHSNLARVRTYIENQEEHHRKMTWEQEFRGLLVRHGIQFDERFFLD
jgi:putative transposase